MKFPPEKTALLLHFSNVNAGMPNNRGKLLKHQIPSPVWKELRREVYRAITFYTRLESSGPAAHTSARMSCGSVSRSWCVHWMNSTESVLTPRRPSVLHFRGNTRKFKALCHLGPLGPLWPQYQGHKTQVRPLFVLTRWLQTNSKIAKRVELPGTLIH